MPRVAFQSVGGEEGGGKRVHQIFQRRGSRDIDFRKRERRAVEFLFARMKFVPVTPLPLGFSLYGLLSCLSSSLPSFLPILFLILPERKRERETLRSFATAPQLRPAIISTCLLLPRRNAYKAKQTISLHTPPPPLVRVCLRSQGATSRRRTKKTSSADKSLISFASSADFTSTPAERRFIDRYSNTKRYDLYESNYLRRCCVCVWHNRISISGRGIDSTPRGWVSAPREENFVEFTKS